MSPDLSSRPKRFAMPSSERCHMTNHAASISRGLDWCPWFDSGLSDTLGQR